VFGQPQRVARQTHVRRPNRARGICLAHRPPIYVLSFLSICGFVTTLSGGVCGCAAPPLEEGLTFGVVGIFTYVCVCRIREGLGMCVAPPTVHPKRVGRRSQFLLADTLIGEMTFTALLELVNSSSTQVPLFMPRHLQTWYSRDTCRLDSSLRKTAG
jgi:hypothetical protein